ncbi:MAG: LysR family transcriptional regulator [Pseudomonadota bacterium]
MDIKRIRYALALAEELSFARAAEKLHLSQPALTRAIQTLEEELGLMLFDRDNRNVKLTVVGAVFLKQARRLMFELRGLQHNMSLIRDAEIGHVSFGAGPLATASMLAQLSRSLRRGRPGLQLTVDSNHWRYLLRHLRAEEIEFFVADTRDIAPDPDLSITPLCRQHGHFLVRAGHPLLERETLVASDALPFGFASMLLPDSFKNQLCKLLGLDDQAALPVAFECNSIFALKELTLNEDVILLATDASVAGALVSGALVALPITDLPPLYAELGIVELAGRSTSPGARLVQEQFGAIAATLPGCIPYLDGRFDDTVQARAENAECDDTVGSVS